MGNDAANRRLHMVNVLVLCDDVWHPVEVIERGLADVQDQEFHFDIVCTAKDILTPEYISKYPVIMNCKGNSISAANKEPWFEDGVTEVGVKEFAEYVKAGGGFLSVHAGNTVGLGNNQAYVDFVGNNFVTHPPRCEVKVTVEKEHPITEGVKDFIIRDEHYELGEFADDIDVFLKASSEKGGTQIAGYTRELGNGKICVLTPGHTLSVWQNEMFRRLLFNAIRWAMKQE